MNLINLDVSEWGLDLSTYFGDVYVAWRTVVLAVVVVSVMRITKIIRKRVSA